MTTASQDAIAAFLAKGGKVAKIAAGATCGMTARDFRNAARDKKPIEVVQETVYIPEQGMVVLLSNFLRNKGMFRIERNLINRFDAIDAEFRAMHNPTMGTFSGATRRLIREILLSIVEGFTFTELEYLDIDVEEYHALNSLYRAVGGSIKLL